MKNKRILPTTALLFALAVLALSLVRVSAVPESPYIMVVPEKTLNTALTPGSTYTVTIYTNYEGSDVWSWQFALTFNPAVLNGTGVDNGDLITTAKDPSAYFEAGDFNNTEGTLDLTYAMFDYGVMTSGPGTFATVSFDVIGYGSSDISFKRDRTSLLGPDYSIIDGITDYYQVGDGFFSNKLIGDANGDTKVDVYDLHRLGKSYESMEGPPVSPNWDSDCDFNHDFVVNGTDLTDLRTNYGDSI